jgi:hypothetical protein
MFRDARPRGPAGRLDAGSERSCRRAGPRPARPGTPGRATAKGPGPLRCECDGARGDRWPFPLVRQGRPSGRRSRVCRRPGTAAPIPVRSASETDTRCRLLRSLPPGRGARSGVFVSSAAPPWSSSTTGRSAAGCGFRARPPDAPAGHSAMAAPAGRADDGPAAAVALLGLWPGGGRMWPRRVLHRHRQRPTARLARGRGQPSDASRGPSRKPTGRIAESGGARRRDTTRSSARAHAVLRGHLWSSRR